MPIEKLLDYVVFHIGMRCTIVSADKHLHLRSEETFALPDGAFVHSGWYQSFYSSCLLFKNNASLGSATRYNGFRQWGLRSTLRFVVDIAFNKKAGCLVHHCVADRSLSGQYTDADQLLPGI